MFWWIVLAVVVVGFALAWWSSGRTRRGVDSAEAGRSHSKSEGEMYPYRNNGPFGGGTPF